MQEEINYGRGGQLLSSEIESKQAPTDSSRNIGGVGSKLLHFNLTSTAHSNLFADVRIRKAPSKVELKSRLYDNGLSEKTMPSVHRPNAPLEGTPSIKAKLNKGDIPSGRIEIGK